MNRQSSAWTTSATTARLSDQGGLWTNASSRAFKTGFTAIDEGSILEMLARALVIGLACAR